jgi:methyl-accepting chemotaxis protein
MKITTKIIVFLILSFLLVTVFTSMVSISSLLNNQRDNLRVSNNEFLEISRELVQDNAKFFFRLFDRKIQDSPSLTRVQVLDIINEIEPFSNNTTVVMDIGKRVLLGGTDHSEIKILLDKYSVDQAIGELTLNRNKDFYLDNYNQIRKDKEGRIIPVAAHFRIYDKLGLIVGYGKAMEAALVRIDYMKKKNMDYFKLSLLFYLFIYVLTLILVVFLSLRFIKIFFILPLKQIGTIVSQVAKGDLSARITLDSQDEIGELSRAFNAMTQDLQSRTTSIDNLNNEIAERKKIEEESAKHARELEIFYKVSMGREERIIELKKEVAMLKAELDKHRGTT